MTRNTFFAEPEQLLCREFPYVLWTITPEVYSLQPLPSQASRDGVVRWIGTLSRSLRRRAALVFGPSECVYYTQEGDRRWSDHPPTGGIAFQASVAIPDPPADCLPEGSHDQRFDG